ncbi:acetate--CoA ligase [soil metagenome]
MDSKSFFSPKAIAIGGVSQNSMKVGHLVARNMIDQGYVGDLYFVNPKGETVLGKKTFTDLKAIGKKIELVIFAIPADAIIPYLDRVKEVGCHQVVVFAAGFKENHTVEGDLREKKLLEAIDKNELTLLGPNCIGYVNTHTGINATFLKTSVPKGNIGIISQSGALGSALVDYYTAQSSLGISTFVSLGNKSNMTECDVLDYMADDPKTSVIGMYLEDVTDGTRFRRVLQSVVARKPVVILKAGRTAGGSQAAVSHTASMVGDDTVFEAAIRQAGAIRIYTFSHFQEILQLFSFKHIPRNRNILVLSNAGGMGVMLADEICEHTLNLITVSEETKKKLYGAFDEYKKITVHNPIDLLGDASAFDYQKAINLTMKEHDLGATIVLLTPQANTEIKETADVLIAAQKKNPHIPIYPVFMGGSSVKEAHTHFEKNALSSYRFFTQLPRIIARICDANEYQLETSQEKSHDLTHIELATHQPDIQTLLIQYLNKKVVNQYDSLKIIEYAGIASAKPYLATSEEDLQRVIEREGFPLVAKIASEKITHKTEVKGVMTGLNSWDELQNAYQYMTRLSGEKEGCYIQKEYKGQEFIFGAKRDNTFGTVLMIGLGGIYAELLKETVSMVFPFSFSYLRREINSTKMKKLFEGYRNMEPVDMEKLFHILYKLGALMEQFSMIKEIDINPLIASGKQLIAVDARIIL